MIGVTLAIVVAIVRPQAVPLKALQHSALMQVYSDMGVTGCDCCASSAKEHFFFRL